MPNGQMAQMLDIFGPEKTRKILGIVFPLISKYKLTNRLPGDIPTPHHRDMSIKEREDDPNYYSQRYKKYDTLYELYNAVWENICDRCYNKNNLCYIYYGGRGIGVYKPWIENKLKFIMYCIKNLGEKPKPYYVIDRIDNNRGYYPGNLRWAHPKVSGINKECSICKNDDIRYACSYIYKYYNITLRRLLSVMIAECLIVKEYSPKLQIAFNASVHKNIINV